MSVLVKKTCGIMSEKKQREMQKISMVYLENPKTLEKVAILEYHPGLQEYLGIYNTTRVEGNTKKLNSVARTMGYRIVYFVEI